MKKNLFVYFWFLPLLILFLFDLKYFDIYRGGYIILHYVISIVFIRGAGFFAKERYQDILLSDSNFSDSYFKSLVSYNFFIFLALAINYSAFKFSI